MSEVANSRHGIYLPADFSRCNGTICSNGVHVCPHRDNCLRFISPVKPGFEQQQRWVFVCGVDVGDDCPEMVLAVP